MRKPVISRAARACITLAIPFALAAAAPGAAASVSWFIGGTSSELPKCSNCEASLPPSGQGSIGSLDNSANRQLSPSVAIVASDLSVHVDVAPNSGTKRIFFLFVRATPSINLKCEIAAGSQTCSSGTQTLAIPPASPLVIDAFNMGNAPATTAQYSWKATAP